MASKKLKIGKHVEDEDERQTLDEVYEEPFHASDEGSDSDFESEGGGATEMVPPKKPKFSPTRQDSGPGPGEDGSGCSSPSASGFIIMPAAKPREKKKKKAAASKKFSHEEEIALLKGLQVFWASGRNNKWTEFHLFIKDDLPRQYTKIQVSEKIRGLKRKFETNLERARANRGRPDFSDRHESLVFELSKTLWGEKKSVTHETRTRPENERDEENKIPLRRNDKTIEQEIRNNAENDCGDGKKVPHKRKLVVEIGKEEFESEYPLLCASFAVFGYPKFVKENCFLMGREKARELEEKWRELNAEVLRLELGKFDLIRRDLLDHHRSK